MRIFVLRLLSLSGATFPNSWFQVFGRPIQLLRGEVDRLAVYVRDGFSAFRQRNYESECCKDIVVRIRSSSHIFDEFAVYRRPDLSDNIFDCLLTAMTNKVQFGVGKASICLLAT